jgi:hypothetical protein
VSAPEGLMVITGPVSIVTWSFAVTCCGEAQLALEVTIQLTVSPLVNDEVLKTVLFVPAFAPLTCH